MVLGIMYIYVYYMGSRPKTPAPFTVKLDLNTLKETYIYIYALSGRYKTNHDSDIGDT